MRSRSVCHHTTKREGTSSFVVPPFLESISAWLSPANFGDGPTDGTGSLYPKKRVSPGIRRPPGKPTSLQFVILLDNEPFLHHAVASNCQPRNRDDHDHRKGGHDHCYNNVDGINHHPQPGCSHKHDRKLDCVSHDSS